MIAFSPEEVERLAAEFGWYRAYGGPLPLAIASLPHPSATALHFAEPRHVARLRELPDGACVLVPAGTTVKPGLRTQHHPSPKLAVRDLLLSLRRSREARQTFRDVGGATIANGADIEEGARIEPGAVVLAPSYIGTGSEVRSGAVIRTGVRIERGCCIQSGAVVGDDGFGYAFDPKGDPYLIPHMGGVVLEEEVTIGPNAVVSAGTIDPTRVGARTKIDGQAYVGHNARVGRRSFIAAGAVIGGSAVVGDDVWIHPLAMVRTKLSVGDGATVGAGAIVMKSVPAKTTVVSDIADEAIRRLRREAAIDRVVAASTR